MNKNQKILTVAAAIAVFVSGWVNLFDVVQPDYRMFGTVLLLIGVIYAALFFVLNDRS